LTNFSGVGLKVIENSLQRGNMHIGIGNFLVALLFDFSSGAASDVNANTHTI